MNRAEQIAAACLAIRKAAACVDDAQYARDRLDHAIRTAGRVTPLLAARTEAVAAQTARAEARYTNASRTLHALAPTEAELGA